MKHLTSRRPISRHPCLRFVSECVFALVSATRYVDFQCVRVRACACVHACMCACVCVCVHVWGRMRSSLLVAFAVRPCVCESQCAHVAYLLFVLHPLYGGTDEKCMYVRELAKVCAHGCVRASGLLTSVPCHSPVVLVVDKPCFVQLCLCGCIRIPISAGAANVCQYGVR